MSIWPASPFSIRAACTAWSSRTTPPSGRVCGSTWATPRARSPGSWRSPAWRTCCARPPACRATKTAIMTEQATAADAMAYAQAGALSAVRAFVAAKASALGLPASRVELLILAVSELTTNTLQHTTGGGRIRVWRGGDQVACDVVDGGPLRSPGYTMPPADMLR